MLERARIAGVSKTTYVPATPRCLEWRHDLPRTSTIDNAADSDSQEPRRRPARRHRGDRRRPRLPVARVLVLEACVRRSVARDGVAGIWPGRGPDRTASDP